MELKKIIMVCVCVCVLVIVTFMAASQPKLAPTSLPGFPNTVLNRKEEPSIDPLSNTSALPPAENSSSQRGANPIKAMADSRNKVILLWTKYYDMAKWDNIQYEQKIWNGLSEGMLSCARFNINVSCRITYNKQEYEHSDLVAFHGRGFDFTLKNLPNLSKRLPHQRWVYFNRESPAWHGLLNDPSQGKHLNGLFNWTMTYMLNSDIDYRYGRIVPGVSPGKYNTQTPEMAVAVVSNCMPERLKYINELKKYIQVRMYGFCVTHKWPNGPRKAWFAALKGKYKFFLSFENSICKDYMTEKFYYDALQYNMIPVTINRGNFSDPTVAPPGCCINALDFKGARELAEYLRKVASNSTLYSSYFKWHSRYKVQEDSFPGAFCRACHKLYTDSETKVYHNLYSWYGTKENCVPYLKP